MAEQAAVLNQTDKDITFDFDGNRVAFPPGRSVVAADVAAFAERNHYPSLRVDHRKVDENGEPIPSPTELAALAAQVEAAAAAAPPAPEAPPSDEEPEAEGDDEEPDTDDAEAQPQRRKRGKGKAH
jgi:hypothetical protein